MSLQSITRTAPAFWWPDPHAPQKLNHRLAKWALFPASYLYGRVVARRMAMPGHQGALPVVCIGNFVAGGAGKTPTALAIAAELKEMGLQPAFISRGYGGSMAASGLQVDASGHTAEQVGDEPLLLARHGETFIGPNRLTSVIAAAERGAHCAIFDDGFQNPSVTKNLSLLVVDAGAGIGNGFCHPSGPLRAPLGMQMDMADAIIVVGSTSQEASGPQPAVRMAARRGKPILSAMLELDLPDHVQDRPLLAFCGIGRPQKFFDGLEDADLDVVHTVPFPDHHPFTTEDADMLIKEAQARNALLVTTEKDMARLSRASGVLADLASVTTPIPARLVFEDPKYLRSILEQAVRQWRQDMLLLSIA
ncbi:MAG: tetraacyldisaccharide 4'-kinase [Hyphomicrobiales bacterium]